MTFNIALLRELLFAVEARPKSLGEFEGAMDESDRKQIRELRSLALRARLLSYQWSKFGLGLDLTAAGRQLLALLRNGDFTVVLMNDDDLNSKNAAALQPRPRQVIFELGCFKGKARRTRICAIRIENTEFSPDVENGAGNVMDVTEARLHY
jgi:hypothetical protein